MHSSGFLEVTPRWLLSYLLLFSSKLRGVSFMRVLTGSLSSVRGHQSNEPHFSDKVKANAVRALGNIGAFVPGSLITKDEGNAIFRSFSALTTSFW